MVLEVDMHPFATGIPRVVDRYMDQAGANAGAASRRRDERVEDKRVSGTVPCDVDESHQNSRVAGANPAEAVLVHLPPPVVIQDRVFETFGM